MSKFFSLSAENTYLRLLRGFVLSIFLKGCIVNDMKANENTPHTKASQQETKTQHKGKPNHLINEKSPYLQQHAYNPVDWYPWGEEAFQKAVRKTNPFSFPSAIQRVIGVMSWNTNHLRMKRWRRF